MKRLLEAKDKVVEFVLSFTKVDWIIVAIIMWIAWCSF